MKSERRMQDSVGQNEKVVLSVYRQLMELDIEFQKIQEQALSNDPAKNSDMM